MHYLQDSMMLWVIGEGWVVCCRRLWRDEFGSTINQNITTYGVIVLSDWVMCKERGVGFGGGLEGGKHPPCQRSRSCLWSQKQRYVWYRSVLHAPPPYSPGFMPPQSSPWHILLDPSAIAIRLSAGIALDTEYKTQEIDTFNAKSMWTDYPMGI